MRVRLPVSAASPIVALALVQVSSPSQPPMRDGRPFQSGIELTSITATVTDRDGRLVAGLPREAFAVYEDGERQEVTHFSRERVPVGVGVLLDVSDSMFGARIQDARTAVSHFLFELLAPTDEFFLTAFNHAPRPLTGWTRVHADVERALADIRPSGGTAIYDAIVEALPMVERRARERAALLVISDGADTASTATLKDVRAALLRSEAFIYAIAIDPPDQRAINTRVNVQTLREITAESGGRTEVVHSSADLVGATARMAEELNSQYVLGYTSPRGPDGRFHSIRVTAGADYRVRTRTGYVATPLARRKG